MSHPTDQVTKVWRVWSKEYKQYCSTNGGKSHFDKRGTAVQLGNRLNRYQYDCELVEGELTFIVTPKP